MKFGEYITQKRRDSSMSQKELADLLEISYPYMCDIEKGKRSPKGKEMIESIANYLVLDADYLYYLTDQIPAKERGKLSEEQFKDAYSSFKGVINGKLQSNICK